MSHHEPKCNPQTGSSHPASDRRPWRSVVPALLLSMVLNASAEDAPPAWVDEARQGAQALGGQLQQALSGAIRQDGVVAAIEVCQHQAPAIADRVSSESMAVGRTALRVRNPRNEADPWETRILQDFQRRMAQGEDPSSLEIFAIRHVDGQRQGHWMKAIPTGGLCLTCHGSELDPELQATIDQRYPDDRAVGFSAGDLRGAFSVRVDLSEPD